MSKLSTLIGVGKRAAAFRLAGRRAPVNVMISVTNRCQAKCSYCNISTLKQREMTTDELTSLLDQIRAAGCERIALWGGEPLLREDIGAIVAHAKKLGLYVTMDSNGFAVPEKLDVVGMLDVLLISLDGKRENHDQNRVPGGFDKALAGIRAAVKIVPVFTITVLTKNNVGDVPFILETAKAEGFGSLFQLLYHNPSEAGDTHDLLPSQADYRKAIRTIIEHKKRGYPVVNSRQYLEHLLRWDDYKRPIRREESKPGDPVCVAGRLYCNVDVDGQVYPCNALMKEVPSENFLDVGFEKAFQTAGRIECAACDSCLNEFNLLLSVNPGACLNWLGYTLFGKAGRVQRGGS